MGNVVKVPNVSWLQNTRGLKALFMLHLNDTTIPAIKIDAKQSKETATLTELSKVQTGKQ